MHSSSTLLPPIALPHRLTSTKHVLSLRIVTDSPNASGRATHERAAASEEHAGIGQTHGFTY